MPFDNNYTLHLSEIIKLIEDGKINGADEALAKFNTYLDLVQGIGQFDAIVWKVDWRKTVWQFGELFKKRDPVQFIHLLGIKINSTSVVNKEVLEFIRSEIIVNFLPDSECKKQIETLISQYPYNPEFRNSLGHFYAREGNHLRSIEEYKLALKIEPDNRYYLRHRFGSEWDYLTNLISSGNYQIGKNYVNEVFDENFYKKKETTYYNAFVDFNQRLDDHILFQEKLKSLESDFREKMKTELDGERKRIIEILGFFSAVIAFILATVSIGKNFSFPEAIHFITALGIILILFTVSLSVLFSPSRETLFKDVKFWILIFGLLLLLILILPSSFIASIVDFFSYFS